MARSGLRSGLWDARDRGRKRYARRRIEAERRGSAEEIADWVNGRLKGYSLTELERLDLDGFVHETSGLSCSPGERLRWLAVTLELEAMSSLSRLGWAVLNRIYEKALRLAPGEAAIVASHGVSAVALSQGRCDEFGRRLISIGKSKLVTAESLNPDDSWIAYSLGYALYVDDHSATGEALDQFDRALSLEKTHAWSLLFRAHCLQDLEQWSGAAVAYSRVPLAEFTGPSSWRVQLLHEQRAWCLLRAGDIGTARIGFEKILAQYERQPSLGRWVSEHLEDAASEAFPDLRQRVANLRTVWRDVDGA